MSNALANLTMAQLAQIPAGVPPPGVIPNLVNPHSEGYVLITVGTIMMVIMFVFVAMRLFVRLKIQHKITPDDYSTALAVIGTILYYATCVYGVTKAQYATHLWDISVAKLMSDEFLICSFFLNWPTALVWAVTKTSFFLMYLNLFKPIEWLRIGCYIGLIVNWGFYMAVVAASLYYSAPGPGQTWLQGFNNPRYQKSFNMTMPIASGSLILDCYILVLPIGVIWNLHLDLKRRLGVLAIFATGVLACIASSLSIFFKHRLSGHLADFTYWTYPICLMALVEMCIGISCSSMPALAALWRHVNGDDNVSKSGLSFWRSAIFVPIRSLFSSSYGSGGGSKDVSGSHKKDSHRIYKSSAIERQVDSESTRGLASEHEMVYFVNAQANKA